MEDTMRLRNIPGAKDAITESRFVIQNPQENKSRWSSVFPKEQPLHIEVGMGKGRFLMDMARLHPDINYVGIEMYDSVLLRALQKREELEESGEGLENLFFMRVDARNLPDIFMQEEVDRVYLNFSDPWPKARHAKRRLTSREFLERYDKILAKDGVVEFKTDNRELFEFSLEEVRESKWKLLAHTFDLHHNEEMMQGNVMTEYEEKFSSMGNPICKMVIAR
jgi:tRNA (guanine-N7-)-methyltransferase